MPIAIRTANTTRAITNTITPPASRLRRSRVLMLGMQTLPVSEPSVDDLPASWIDPEPSSMACHTVDIAERSRWFLEWSDHEASVRDERCKNQENKIHHDIGMLPTS